MEYEQRIQKRLTELQQTDRYRQRRIVHSHADGTCTIDGLRVVNFGANDYLNLSHEVGDTTVAGVLQEQVGATASALIAGRSEWHDRLECTLAEFEGSEAALLFPTGFAANLGVLIGLLERGDAVFCDRDNHASLIDAARFSDGKFYVFRRDRLEQLESAISRRRNELGQVYIVTDGVFSMDGEIPDLEALTSIADRFDCQLIVDEAHGTGVLGERGRGACDFSNVEDRVRIRIGTMSKAMGGIGGFAVSDQATIELLRHTARTQFFSTALPPSICAAMLNSIQVIATEPERRNRLGELTALAHATAKECGLQIVGNGIAPIFPVLMSSDSAAVEASNRLFERGFFVPAIRPPTVPEGTARLRLSFSTVHTKEQIKQAMDIVVKCRASSE